MEARAVHKYISTSPRKMRLVIDLIRGKSVSEAMEILHFNTQHASNYAEKVLRSAVANLFVKAEKEDDSTRYETDDLFVKEVFVNEGPSMKRVLPAPMGRAYRIRKRSNHLTIVVATKS